MIILGAAFGVAQSATAQSSEHAGSASVLRDGQPDFEIGNWKSHIHRLVHPPCGSNEWADYDGASDHALTVDGAVLSLAVAGPCR